MTDTIFLNIFTTILRAITVANKTLDAQELIMTNIHGRFLDLISNSLGALCNTNFKMPIFTISRAVLRSYWDELETKPQVHNNPS